MGNFSYFCSVNPESGYYENNSHHQKSVKRYDTESKATIYARLRDGRQVDMVAPTRLTINPNLWDDKAEQVKSKIVCDDEMRSYYNDEARKLKSYLEKAYQSRQVAEPQKEWLKEALEQYYNPQKYNVETATEETAKPTLIALFDEFLKNTDFPMSAKRITGSSNEDYNGMNFISGQPRGGKKHSYWT